MIRSLYSATEWTCRTQGENYCGSSKNNVTRQEYVKNILDRSCKHGCVTLNRMGSSPENIKSSFELAFKET